MVNDLVLFFRSDMFWTALSAISTFVAVLVAMFLPFYQRRRAAKNRLRAINVELSRNQQILAQLKKVEPIITPDNKKVPVLIIQVEMAKSLSLTIWQNHWVDLSLEYPKEFHKLNDINLAIKDIQDRSQSVRKEDHQLIPVLVESMLEKFDKW